MLNEGNQILQFYTLSVRTSVIPFYYGFSSAKQCCGSGMFIPDPGSDFFPSRIPDPNCLHPGYRILIKEFKYFIPPKSKKMVSKL
jgi:hypothetical protein